MMKEGMNKLDEELMAKFLMGECSEEELCKVNAWLNESDGNARELFRIEQIYHLGKSEEFADEKKIEKAEKQLFKRLAQEEAKRNKVRRLNAWMRYAAMFIGIFFISGLSYHIYQSQSEESKLVAVTARDEVKELMLPDGTKVWLNKHTTLKYPREFSEKGRNVYMEGEAYFEVAKDKDKPFIVKTKEQSIEALGTKFNVSAYPTDSLLTTTLLEGSVLLTTQNLLHPTVLKPNEQFVYNKRTRSALLQQVDANRFVSWTTGYYYFPEQSLEAILYRLSHVYGVQFTVKSEALNRRTFTGTFYRGQSIKDIMEIIHLSIPIRYKIDDHHVTISEI